MHAPRESTWESLTELEIGTIIGGMVPEDAERQLVITRFLGRTAKGNYLYKLEVMKVIREGQTPQSDQ